MKASFSVTSIQEHTWHRWRNLAEGDNESDDDGFDKNNHDDSSNDESE